MYGCVQCRTSFNFFTCFVWVSKSVCVDISNSRREMPQMKQKFSCSKKAQSVVINDNKHIHARR